MADLLRVRPGTVRNRLSRRDADLPPSAVNGRRRLFPVAAYEAWKQRLLPPLQSGAATTIAGDVVSAARETSVSF
jgi:hypothetical protein